MRRIVTIIIALAIGFGPAFSQKKDTYQVRTLVIDPGHGGAKPGAQGSKVQEKELTLAVAKKFGQLIEDNYPDVKVIYTRTSDVDISLAERAHIANRNKADLFISIHANSHPTKTPTGVETFVMGLSESRANLEVARKENADILLEADYKNNADYQGFDPDAPETYVMLTMFQNAFIDKSLNLAQAIQTQYKQNIKTINRGVKQAELYVLYKTSMPSVLTEIGFISNPAEEEYMMSDEGQATIAICLFNAFMTYKATEEGSNKIAKPVIRIKGYKPEAAVQQPAAPAEPAKPEPVVEENPALSEPPAVAEEKPAATEEAKPATTVQAPATPATTTRPVPSAEIPKRVKEEAAPEPEAKPAPEPAKAATAAPAKPSPTPAPAPRRVKGIVPPVNTAKSESQYYTVQFLTSDHVLKAGARELCGIEEFEVVRKGRYLCYHTGHFATFKEATEYCEMIKASTEFKDAWTLLYKRKIGEKPLAESKADRSALPVEQPIATTPAPAPAAAQAQPVKPAPEMSVVDSNVVFRVQFLTSPRELKLGDPDLHGISDFRSSQSGSYYLYTAGNYLTRREAMQRCKSIKNNTPFKDAFVVAFRNGVRVPLDSLK